jgi:hypothetical protein
MRPRDPHDDPPAKRRPQPYLGPPVKLGHIRSHGARNLLIYALPAAAIQRSHHTDRWPDETTLIGLCPKAACTRCDMVGADVRPNWSERPRSESLTGMAAAMKEIDAPRNEPRILPLPGAGPRRIARWVDGG